MGDDEYDADTARSSELLRRLQKLDGNNRCADCGRDSEPPDWASLNLGVLFCLNCSGEHRALGVQKSFVRSVALDKWTPDQERMVIAAGGNAAVNAFLLTHGCDIVGGVQQKYSSPAAELWRRRLAATFKGETPPETLPAEDLDSIRQENAKAAQARAAAATKEKAAWVPDEQAVACQKCKEPFSFIKRRHHCRRCGRCVCANCAPRDNVRPIPEWGLKECVRHCTDCYKAPAVAQRLQATQR